MTREVRNLKGEIVSDIDPDERWWHFSHHTWLLIAGLVLFNIGCFVSPNVIDLLFRMLDVCLWPWWYFLIFGVIVLFSVKWFFFYSRWEDYDEAESDVAMRFLRLSIAVTVVSLLWILLHATGGIYYFSDALTDWFRFGDFTWMAVLTLALLLGVVGLFVYLFKEWIVIFGGR